MDKQRTAPVDHTPGWPRAAIYFAPAADSALHDFGADWLGRDALIGAPRPTPTVDGIAPERLAAITADARRYGFHATLRAPFHPADGVDIARIIAAAEAFGAARKPFDLSLEVANHKGFLALTPVQAPAALGVLEADLLAHFDALVRPPSPDELARRRQANLNPAQDAHLTALGLSLCAGPVPFSYDLDRPVERPGGACNAVRRPARARRAGARRTASR